MSGQGTVVILENSSRSALTCERPITSFGSRPSIMAANAVATSGWNWLPALSRSSATASCGVSAGRYARLEVIAS